MHLRDYLMGQGLFIRHAADVHEGGTEAVYFDHRAEVVQDTRNLIHDLPVSLLVGGQKDGPWTKGVCLTQ